MSLFFRKKFKATKYSHKKDSDRDGLSDWDEVHIYGTNPYNPDTDKDGVSDGQEVAMGRNPRGPGKLKDLFIPYAGNDYNPEILRPNRLIFYTISVLLAKLIVVILIIFIPLGALLTPDVLRTESKKIIELTNKLRQSLAVPELKENELLNQAAYKKAEDMLIQQYFAHIGPDRKDVSDWLLSVGYRYDIAGENLAMGFAHAEDVVSAWKKSPAHYANLIDSDFSEIGVSMTNGMYNNFETTLVAQFFAYSSKAQDTEIKTSAITKTETPTEPTTPAVPETTKVDIPKTPTQTIPVKSVEQKTQVSENKISYLPENPPAVEIVKPIVAEPIIIESEEIKEIKHLAAPKLIFPKDKAYLGGNEITLIVYAPQAEKVIVYEDSKKIAEKDSLASDFFDLKINLENGQHNLSLKAIKGDEKSTSPQKYSLVVDSNPPLVDIEKSKIVIIEPQGQNEKLAQATVYLSPDTTKAEVLINDYRIELEKGIKQSNGNFVWSGQMVIYKNDENKIFNPITLPTVLATDEFGNTARVDIGFENITPIKPSLLKQYFFAKFYPTNYLEIIFDINGWFYKLILIVAVISLLLNIFIEIKKQHPRVILSTLGFITLVAVLIII